VRDAADPAAEIARNIIAMLPDRDISLIVDSRVIGPNLKVSNLANMYEAAKHDVFVIADSDMRVDASYLRTVVAPFREPDVGVVTCLYRGTPAGGLASRLGTMGINEWFLPSVLVALAFEELRFCFGATMAIRRAVLQAIGGFASIAHNLADDHVLGQLAARHGYRTRLSAYLVENIVGETGIRGLLRHEMRWARTIRSARPVGYAFSFVTYTVPMICVSVLVNAAALHRPIVAAISGLCTLLARFALHGVVESRMDDHTCNALMRRVQAWCLVPVRDVLGFLVWAASFLGSQVTWKGHEFSVGPGGLISAKGGDRRC
jgi:ceramide glucosyltransferase